MFAVRYIGALIEVSEHRAAERAVRQAVLADEPIGARMDAEHLLIGACALLTVPYHAIVHGFIAHHGHITFGPTTTRGSEFVIRFPLHSGPLSDGSPDHAPS